MFILGMNLKLERLTTRLPPEDIERLKRIADFRGIGELVRRLIKEGLDRLDKQKETEKRGES